MVWICKDCMHRWKLGKAGSKRHMSCSHLSLPHGQYPKSNLQECPGYKKADEKAMAIIRKHMKDR